jgi:drug/metabolite transporter (DMT)-like permease
MLVLYLVLVPAIVLKQIFHATVRQAAGPVLAFAGPGVIALLLIFQLWKWQERGAPPKRLALAWCLLIGTFGFATSVGTLYSASELHLLDEDVLVPVTCMVFAAAVFTSFRLYPKTLESASARAENYRQARARRGS